MAMAGEGLVLGIDVGCSDARPSTCFCAVTWTQEIAQIEFRLTTAHDDRRAEAISRLVVDRPVAGVAIDGPLTKGFAQIEYYRAAEAVLSRGPLQKRGKPGQTSSPLGKALHAHSLAIANQVSRLALVDDATHRHSIHTTRIVEAFPNLYLGALVPETALEPLRRNASDVYWTTTALNSNLLMRHFRKLLPGRQIQIDCVAIRNHDQRAGLVCALTALAVVQGIQVAVGDPEGGDIMLPPRSSWGASRTEHASWLEPVLRANLASVIARRASHRTHSAARIIENDRHW